MEKNNEMACCGGPGSALKVLKVIGMVIGGVALAILFAFLFGLAIRELWNWLMPDLFGLGKIDYWQAVGLFILGKLLFGGIGHGGGHGSKKSEKKIEKKIEARIKKAFGIEGGAYQTYWEEEGKAAFEAWKAGRQE